MVAFGLILAGSLAGCASPGPPQPPSLHLPEPPKGLTAERVGDRVTLTWTTSLNTTDGDQMRGPIVAVVCREIPDAAELARLARGEQEEKPKPPAAKPNPVKGKKAPPPTASLPVVVDAVTKPIPCNPIERFGVAPGLSHAVETLPATLTTGAPKLIGYKVELLNSEQRSAGYSAPAYAAAGAGPDAAGSLEAGPNRGGVLLRWTRHDTGAVVEVRRTLLQTAPGTAAAHVRPASAAGPARVPVRKNEPGRQAGARDDKAGEPVVLAPPPGTQDAGGMLDATVLDGGTYSYVAQRVLRVTLAGKPLELRGEPSPATTVLFKDVFPPAPPVGLEAAVDGGFGRPLAVDLSWEPNTEPDLAGYYVLRVAAPGGPGATSMVMEQLNASPLTAPAFRDLTVVAGKAYEYRVVAVDALGNRSTASEPVRQALPQP